MGPAIKSLTIAHLNLHFFGLVHITEIHIFKFILME